MGWPEHEIVIAPLSVTSAQVIGKIEQVALLGHGGRLQWKHEERGLVVQLPPTAPCEHAFCLEIVGLAPA